MLNRDESTISDENLDLKALLDELEEIRAKATRVH